MPEMDSHPNMNAVAASPKHETDGETDLVVSSVQMAPAVCEQSEAASRIIAKQSWLSTEEIRTIEMHQQRNKKREKDKERKIKREQ